MRVDFSLRGSSLLEPELGTAALKERKQREVGVGAAGQGRASLGRDPGQARPWPPAPRPPSSTHALSAPVPS